MKPDARCTRCMLLRQDNQLLLHGERNAAGSFARTLLGCGASCVRAENRRCCILCTKLRCIAVHAKRSKQCQCVSIAERSRLSSVTASAGGRLRHACEAVQSGMQVAAAALRCVRQG